MLRTVLYMLLIIQCHRIGHIQNMGFKYLMYWRETLAMSKQRNKRKWTDHSSCISIKLCVLYESSLSVYLKELLLFYNDFNIEIYLIIYTFKFKLNIKHTQYQKYQYQKQKQILFINLLPNYKPQTTIKQRKKSFSSIFPSFTQLISIIPSQILLYILNRSKFYYLQRQKSENLTIFSLRQVRNPKERNWLDVALPILQNMDFKSYYIVYKIVMGNCAKFQPKDRTQSLDNLKSGQGAVLDKYNEEPQDTNSLANISLPTIDMRPLLRKVKLKNSPQKKIGLRFLIGEADQILLPQKNVDQYNSVKWEIEENFQYFLTQYQLRKQFLQVDLMVGGAVIGSLRINTYLICIGPYHLDFEVPMNIQSKPRVSFDFKISQVVNMRIDTKNVEVYNMKEFVGEEYAFSLKTIFGNKPQTSQFSKIFKVQHEVHENIPIAIWSNSQSPMPYILACVPFYEFHYATLKYIFYKVDLLNKTDPYKPIAECYISFVKLLGFDSNSTITKDKIDYEIKNIQLQEKLWINGKQCGKVKLKLKFEIQKHLKQMLVCVRTQKGILKASPVFQTQGGNSKKEINKEITELEQVSEKVMNQETNIEKRRDQALKKGYSSQPILTKQSYNILQRNLQKQIQILQKSSKESAKIYEYGNEEELIKGQNFLLKLGDKTLKFINQQGDEKLTNLKWKVLAVLIQRGELSLSYIGFDTNKNSALNPNLIAKKKAVGLKLQEFQYKLLEQTLKILGIKGFSEQKKFAELFCAMSYFRIPQFRQRILSLIDKPDDPQITQWRGTDFSLNATHNQFKAYLPGENTFQILFDWQKYFYDYIKTEAQYTTNLHKLEQVLQNKQWEVRISKRRGAFFAFVSEWVTYVTRTSVRIVHSNWRHFPGYIQIIKSLMAQMKIRQIKQYPSSIKAACSSLLSNENLLNTFVTILFNRTNINNNVDVIKIMELVSSFFTALKMQNKRIPSTFNYTFFYTGIKMVIENLYSYSTAKVIHLIYEQFDFFAYELRIELCNYMLGRIFFKLFLHWSYNVRVIFHHVLIVRIYKFFSNQLKESNLDPETRIAIRKISARYSELLIILENVAKMKAKIYVPSTQDELYKKLRNNIRKKKKNLRKGAQVNKNEVNLNQIPDTNLAYESALKTKEEVNRVMSQLARPKLEKYDSQLISKDITIALSNETPAKKKDEIIRKRINSGNFREMPASQKQILEQEEVHKKAPVSMNTSAQVEMPTLSQEDVRYAVPAMAEFNMISNGYLDSIKKNKGDPVLKMEIMLDSSQMKPQEFNDVQQW